MSSPCRPRTQSNRGSRREHVAVGGPAGSTIAECGGCESQLLVRKAAGTVGGGPDARSGEVMRANGGSTG